MPMPNDSESCRTTISGGEPREPEAAAASGTEGRFRILRPHARGGLGEVFLASDQELHREVALKEIVPSLADDPQLRARFLLEAEVTGSLEHPGIVPVYGLGYRPDGRPYYAMRFIRGESLREAIDRLHGDEAAADRHRHTLTLRQLLGRFVTICNTVAYAHSRGVIHRDLKPENVMLGPYGETLLVDWGLAKLVESGATPAADQPLQPTAASSCEATQLGTATGTLAYMSPEQAAGLVDQLGPASDVYSLGATLYVLLTGRIPFEGNEYHEVRQQVLSGKFPPPRKVAPSVPRPLEAICLKAMAWAPQDRYASAQAMAEDIEAWLAGERVQAWREPFRVRAGRWMRRHRTLVAGSIAAAVVALVSLTTTVVLLTAANNREREARGQADYNFGLAQGAVEGFLTRVGEDPRLRAHALEPLRRDLLESARGFHEHLIRQKPTDPQLRWRRALAYLRLAYIEDEIGSKSRAISLLQEAQGALAALSDEFPENLDYSVSLTKCLINLAALYESQGRTAEAAELLKEARALNEYLSRRHPQASEPRADLALVFNNLARIDLNAGRYSSAEEHYRQAIAIDEALLQEQPSQVQYAVHQASTYSNLSVLYNLQEQSDKALAALEQARAIQEKIVAAHSAEPLYLADLATTETNIGNVLSASPDRLSDAEAAYQSAIERRKQLVAKHPEVPGYRNDLALTHHNLASLWANQERFAEAEGAYKQALSIHRELVAMSPDVPAYRRNLSRAATNLARLYSLTKRPEAALDAVNQAIDACLELKEDDAAKQSIPLYDAFLLQARTLESLGQYQEAAVAWQEVIARSKKDETAGPRLQRTLCLARSGDHASAAKEAEELAKLADGYGPVLYQLAAVYSLASDAASRDEKLSPTERSQLAAKYAEEAVRLLREAHKSGHFKTPENAAKLKQDADLSAIRSREDFQKLVEELSGD